MKYLIIVLLFVTACSEDDPQPSCEQLKQELALAKDAALDHQATGSNGNPQAWAAEQNRLMDIWTRKQGEVKTRACF
jgi:outer membrane lipoprotein-sorting protein